MTSKKKLRSLLGGTLFMVLMLSVHPTTVSASAVGSSTVMDQSVETEDQQSGIQSETQTQASQDSVAAVRASQNGWVKAGDGGWYFYENGQLKTGWLYRNGNWYWLDPDRNGRMAENSWFTYDNNFYYAKGDGAIYKNGFQEVDGNLYYFQSWGGIQKNVYLSISGKMYYVQENGIVARGIVRTMNGHGDLCAFDDTTGAQITQKGWLKKGTSYYWVREDGVLQTGWLLYDDNWYWFDDNGVMMASGWKEINNNLYYFRSWGGIYKNGFQNIGGNEYYFRSWGGVYRNTFFTVKGKTYIAQNDGSIYHASQTGWVQLGDQTYWINQDGSVQTGWLKLEGKWYWLKADGTRAASEWITYDNNRYYFDGDGVMYTGMKEVDGTRYYFHSWGGVYHNESFTWQGKKYWAKDDGTFYTGVCDINGKKYYFKKNGQAATGSYKVKKKYYIFNEKGVFKKYKSEQPVSVGKRVYFVSKKGMVAPGWHVYENKLYYAKKSGVCAKSQTVDGITFTKKSYAANNTNTKSKIKARKIVESITTSKMSRAQKRRACWNYMVRRGRFHYALKYPNLSKKGWQRATALNMLSTKSGNCYSFACGFAALTKEIGDRPVVICGRVSGRRDHASDGMTRHSWVQIGGRNYDPEGQFAGWARGIYGSAGYRVRHSIQRKVVF